MNSKILFIIIGAILSISSFLFTWYKDWKWLFFIITTGFVILFNLGAWLLPIIFQKKDELEEVYAVINYEGKELDLSEEESCRKLIKYKFWDDPDYHTDLIDENYGLPIFKGKENVPKTPLYMTVAKDETRTIWYKIILNRSNGEIGIRRFKNEKEALDDKTEELMVTYPKEKVRITDEFEKEVDGEQRKVKRVITPMEETIEKGEEIE